MPKDSNPTGARSPLENHHLDGADYAILRILQVNNKMSMEQLSKLLAKECIELKGSAVGNRVQALRDNGYIKHDVSILDYKKMNAGDTFIMLVTIPDKTGNIDEDFVEHAKAHADVLEVFEVTGAIDYVLKVCSPGLEEAGKLSRELSKIGANIHVVTHGVNQIHKYTTVIQVPRAGKT